MADTNQLAVVHTCADGIKRVFIAPSSFTVAQLEALPSIDPERDGWEVEGLAPTDGSTPAGFSTDCGAAVVPPAGTKPADPVWDQVALLASRPKLMNNTLFSWDIPKSMVTIGSGATYTGITLANHPYLQLVNTDTGVKVYGNVPNNVSADTQIILNASESYTFGDLSTGASASITVTLQFQAGDFYSNYQYNVADKQAITRIGPDGGAGNIPYVTYTAPDGTVIPKQLMTPYGIGDVGGYPYFYLATIQNPMDGIWQAKYEFLGKTKYGTFVLDGTQKGYTGMGLTDSPSAPPPVVTPKITTMDWYWQFTQRQANSAGPTTVYTYLGNYYILLNVSNGGKPEFWANISLDGSTFPGFQKYTLTVLTNDAKGYTHLWSINSAANVKTYFKVKIEGEDDSKFIFFDLTMPAPPAASTSRAQFYPATGGGNGGSGGGGSTTTDLTTPVSFAGTKSGGYRSTNPNMLDMGYDFSSGRVRNLYNKATQGVPGGFAERYLINDRWYAHDRATKRWWRVNTDGSIVGTATNLSFHPELGILIQMFVVDLSRKMNGTSRDDKGWRDDGVSNASEILRVL